MAISLNQITHQLSCVKKLPALDVQILGIALDSRKVKPGYLFVALSGLNLDGHAFIQDAIERGASAVIGTKPIGALSVPYLQIVDDREALAQVSAAYYDYPARRLTVIGVTGTDGKTTTTNFIFRILQAAGLRTGMISTVNAVIGDRTLDTGFHVTTPESPDVQRYLAEMVEAGLTHVVIEATSHGLAQKRVSECDFDIGVVTNITHEHLDYHGSYNAYFQAKGRLFRMLAETPEKEIGNLRVAILNRNDGSYDYLKSLIEETNRASGNGKREIAVLTYGHKPGVDLRAESIRHTPGGIAFDAVRSDFSIPIQTNLLGDYNVENALAAITTTVVGMGIEIEAAQQGIAALVGIPGRMEPFELGQDFVALVDFAHTPNALRVAIQAARAMTIGRVITVFGSAGLRDKAKRLMMSEISTENADLTVLTAEDPRTESLDGILAEMAVGAEARGGVEGETFWRVPDRGEAIRFAISLAKPGDVVMACGKAHEQSMCFGEIEYSWDDRVAMQAALAEHLGIPGPHMPKLPTSSE
jgi:UDP-N-acetylmuramoyl-L-alanyl-D-glutamate--2,6-diaminopimelate ligase